MSRLEDSTTAVGEIFLASKLYDNRMQVTKGWVGLDLLAKLASLSDQSLADQILSGFCVAFVRFSPTVNK